MDSSSDDNCSCEMKILKDQLSEFGLNEDNLCKQEMFNILQALTESKSKEIEDKLVKSKPTEVDESKTCPSPKQTLKRRYLNVRDRRMPWSILPTTITQAEKARSLAVYIKLMSVNNYSQARQSPNFAVWPPSIQIMEETARIQPLRSTRSGRSVPIYAGFDDDSSDQDFSVTKTKKRKVACENRSDEVYCNKVVSLKRKNTNNDNSRPVKESKVIAIPDDNYECITLDSIVTPKRDICTITED